MAPAKNNRNSNDGTMKQPSTITEVARRISGMFQRKPKPAAAAATAPVAPTPRAHTLIPRDQHQISRSKISPNALKVLYRLKDAGYASYLVGGAVRDLLLGLDPKDFDIATNATPEQVAREFRNCRLIGRRFRLAHVHFGQEIIEVATFRAAGGSDADTTDDGRLLRDNAYGSIEEDAVRRDFAVNALYYNIADFSVRDYTGGMEDLHNRTLTLIGPAEERLREDPVRILRAIRLSAKLGFSIDTETLLATEKVKPLLADVPPARLFDEVLKMMLAGFATQSWAVLAKHDLVATLFGDAGRILSSPDGLQYQRFLAAALKNSDERVAEGKPVTPAFLFAVLLWPAYEAALKSRRLALDSPLEQLGEAADEVVRRAVARVALPKRFSLPMVEIWLLQDRFERRQGKRAERFITHPRFRAAYDFLLLRALQDPTLAPLAQWWTRAQEGETGELLPRPEPSATAAPKRKRRRSRKPRALDAPNLT